MGRWHKETFSSSITQDQQEFEVVEVPYAIASKSYIVTKLWIICSVITELVAMKTFLPHFAPFELGKKKS